ncbi:efflux RND transporter periplasmic adaptor subunit [Chondromyces apiculatus]|uniref:Uncharacterized protein n=1 Tax=Chondromyces apiculatus DSM 436 TaxID=1192034 RepID=A0A017SY85_9BACT|nr:HlyD family efflux transporter periplasmic adaptor subunit [Chondromyces apiculatus]EYF01949.1 Hypothetical protein CAP_7567 [Chondromyces apiculatus DSM 436]
MCADRLALIAVLGVLGALGLTPGCGRATEPGAGPPPPAKLTPKPGETALATVTLSPEAATRLGIEVAEAEVRDVKATLSVAGEVTVPADGAVVLVAPFSARISAAPGVARRPGARVKRGDPLIMLSPFAPLDRDVKAQGERAVAVAAASLEALELRTQRLEKLLQEGGASTRQIEEARAERDARRAELAAGEKRLASIRRAPLDADVTIPLRAPRDGVLLRISVAPGQLVSAGAPLFEILGTPALWVRAAVYAGAASRVLLDAPATITSVGFRPDLMADEPPVTALPVIAPPSADPQSATVDLFYELPEGSLRRPGERVTATLTTSRAGRALVVPWSAVLFDAVGGAWVYVEKAEHTYERSRIDLLRVDGEFAVLAHGPAPSTRVVRTGAAELFGVELGSGK